MPHSQIQIVPLHAREGFLVRLMTAFSIAAARRRDRQHLGRLDAHLLRDIGIDDTAARSECDKPFWRP